VGDLLGGKRAGAGRTVEYSIGWAIGDADYDRLQTHAAAGRAEQSQPRTLAHHPGAPRCGLTRVERIVRVRADVSLSTSCIVTNSLMPCCLAGPVSTVR
jgi:hypothetical protein